MIDHRHYRTDEIVRQVLNKTFNRAFRHTSQSNDSLLLLVFDGERDGGVELVGVCLETFVFVGDIDLERDSHQ